MSQQTAKPKLWTKYFIVACFAFLVGTTVNFMLDNTLTIYAGAVWNSNSIGSLLTTTFTAGSITAAVLAGSISDKVGRRRVLMFGCACFCVGVGAMMLSTNVAFNLVCRVLQGIGKGIFSVAGMAIIADIIPRERTGEGMAFSGMGTTLATAFGPMIGLAIIADGNYTRLFTTNTILMAVAVVMAGLLTYEKKEPYKTRIAEAKRAAQEQAALAEPQKGLWRLFEKGAIPSSLVIFFYGAGVTCIVVFETKFATEVLHAAHAGWYFTAAAVAMLASQLTIGKIIDRHGVQGVVTMGLCCGIVGVLLLITLGRILIIYLICGAMYGLSMQLIYPALSTAVMLDSPQSRKGAASATLNFMMDFGILASSALMGVIVDKVGYIPMFVTCMCFTAVGVVLTTILLRNSARAKRRARMGLE